MKKQLLILGLLIPFFVIGCSTDNKNSDLSSDSSSSSKMSSEDSSSGGGVSTSSVSSSSTLTSSSQQGETVSDYVLYGKFQGSSNYSEKSMTLNTGSSSTEYMILNVALYAGDIFKIHMVGDKYYGINDVKNSSTPKSVEAGPNGNIKIKANSSAIYNIYSSYTYDSGSNGYVHIEKVGEIVDPTTISVDSVSLSNTGKFMKVGTNFTLSASVLPSNATNKNVTWTSSNNSIATVSNGKVQGVSDGKCTITATTVDGHKTASCVVFVSNSEIPMFYLFGTIGGQSIIYGEYKYPAIIDTTNVYYFYDVEVYPGDAISIYDNTGHYYTDYYDHSAPYVFSAITEHKVVRLRFDVLNSYHNYLSVVE